jgi:hypothetical protein
MRAPQCGKQLSLKPRWISRWVYRPWVPWAVLVILVGYGVLRNIPVWPFTLLAPH